MANMIRGKATIATQNTQQSKIIGITAPVPMGDWQATTPYLKLNVVRYNGASYIAKKQSAGVEPTITMGWQEVWQPVAYDGLVTPVGNYPNMTVGKAIQAENDGTGKNIADQFSAIDEIIPSTTSANNQLADKAFVNSSINNLAAFYIEYNAQGDAFPTRADLLSATTFYNAGQSRIPTQNDYAYVLSDESQPKDSLGNYPTTRYSYQGGIYPDGQWGFQYIVNNTSLTQAQVDAINSGITKELVEQIGKGDVLSVNGQKGEVTITPENIGAVNKAGDTMTGTLEIIRTEGNTYFTSTRSDTGNRLGFGIGFGGENRGIWDFKLDKWIYHIDSNGKVYVNGVEPFTVQSPTDTQKGYALYSIGRGSQSNPYYCIGKIRLGDTNIKLSMSGGIYATSGKCDIFMQSTNGNITRITRYNYYGGLNDVYYIKNGDILELYTSLSAYAKLFIELAQTGGVITDLGGQTYSSLPSGATLIPVVQMWQSDPTKLNPTTANGWTVGTNTLKLPSTGIYLVSINGNVALFVFRQTNLAHQIPFSWTSSFSPTTINYSHSASTSWTALNTTNFTITTVAYKRIA